VRRRPLKSYWSAFHFYGFTEQATLTVFLATIKKKRPVIFFPGGPDEGLFRFRFVTLRPDKFFGYRREMVGGLLVLIADGAKTRDATGAGAVITPVVRGGFARPDSTGRWL